MLELVPLGDRAWLARFPTEADARRWAQAVRSAARHGVIDIVLAYRTVSVHVDAEVVGWDSWLGSIVPDDGPPAIGRTITLPVLYDGEDLTSVAATARLDPDDVIALHAGTTYEVFAIGFQPGFPYAGYLPSPLDLVPRRAEPRLRVPAGSVAIAARQTGVYPTELPGGWNLLGRTPLSIVDVASGRFPIRAGDRLTFESIDTQEFAARRGEPLR
jgi:KipI family sensor histidine kinase inhibitor